MNKGKEKIIIAMITIVILVGVFMAFVLSNSQKSPATVFAQNDEKKTVEAVRGGYRWKVFGKEMIADSVDLKTYNYMAANTLVSKPLGTITFSTTDRFTIGEVNYQLMNSEEVHVADYRVNDNLNAFSVDVPNTEGTYIYTFKLNYAKGEAFFGIKVVVTDDNVYEVEDITSFVNTEITDVTNINELLGKLPYHDEKENIMIDDDAKSIKIRYDITGTNKEELLNNTVALFVLIPELESVSYEQNNGNGERDIFFSREEINRIYHRNVLEYATDTESWAKEVIYKETASQEDPMIQQYEQIIMESAEGTGDLASSETIVIQFVPDEMGNIRLNQYEKQTLLNHLSEKFHNVVSVSTEKTIAKANYVKIEETEKVDDYETVLVTYTNTSGNSFEQTYLFTEEGSVMTLSEYQQSIEPSGEAPSGEIEN